MATKQASFKFSLLDQDGQPRKSQGTWGLLGFSDTYRGCLDDADPLIHAIRLAINDQELSTVEANLVRSFCISWLMGLSSDLGQVISYAVQLSPSVDYVTRVGLIGRTARNVASGAMTIAATVMLLDSTWDLVTGQFQPMSGTELAGLLAEETVTDFFIEILLPAEILREIDSNYGLPGQTSPAASFHAEPLFSFLRLCQIRNVVQALDCHPSATNQLLHGLDRRIFALFLVNSRQTEGLIRCGAAETSSAVVAHAAIALGLNDIAGAKTILRRIENGIEQLTDLERAAEARSTLAAIERNLTDEFSDIERRLRRHLAAATTTDALDLVAYPISTTFELLSTIAGGLEKLASNTKAAGFFSLTQHGFQAASTAVDATPDAISQAIKGGVTAEEWARSCVRRVWPFGTKAEPNDS